MTTDAPRSRLAAFLRSDPLRQGQWVIRSRWLQLRGATGEFTHPETSERASRMNRLWESNWASSEPIGHLLRGDHPDQWVRFQSLPGSKQFADNDDERTELVRRHRVLLHQLHGADGDDTLVVIAEDYQAQDTATGWTKKLLPDAWPWRSYREPDGDGAVVHFFWVASGLSSAQLDDLLLHAGNEEADVTITNADLDWLYHPYPGGADVIASTAEDRDRLGADYPDWLPTT